MQLIYQGKDITSAVEISRADIIDNSGGIADSIELQFNDPQSIWSQWQPQKGDRLQLREAGFDSGLMYVDELWQTNGVFAVRALSIPQTAKTPNTQAWEAVRFLEFATELAARHGFRLETYGITNHLYDRVDQVDEADFSFLAGRCRLEGYMLKLTDGKAVIYDERHMEAQAPVRTCTAGQLDGPYQFRDRVTDVFGACRLNYGSISYEFTAPGIAGPILKVNDIHVASLGEAERFAKGLLRSKNKYEMAGSLAVELDPGVAAGNTIGIQGVGMADGIHFCETVIHHLVAKKTVLKVRRPLEGY
ncbi:MAG: phage late control D family protein [bacterium]|jgi:hypothetical protein